ncbi:SIS domain-containing protein [Arsenicicoccus sp. oral taxon 190]|uniref:SIS domain-containing protein n=1 Tax=Arsenicicoccus sp. oral taxon 190 TaxID=1658671 RepID=UPI00067A0ADA|nr:SIS domain-containing protein [Arsenicicoccus sp. oral taxon 190]AKT52700.1 phosphosugar isomerase [Arsenicicoccus sp. oral taxon 190]
MPQIDERLLDDGEEIRRLDSRDYLRALATAGAQVRESVTLADEAGLSRLEREDRPRAVLVCALGGSAVVGDVLAVLAEAHGPVPVTHRATGPLPAWVGPLDLVVAVSLSGRAPGPVMLAAEAARRGAQLVTVGAAESPLAEVTLRARGVHVPVPAGVVASRTSTWAMLTPVLRACASVGVVDLEPPVVARLADVLDAQAEACRPSSESFVNPAKVAAAQLVETVPLVLGDGPLMGAAARRAASALARTARIPAMPGALPDNASQVVATFGGPYTAAAGRGVGSVGHGVRGVGGVGGGGRDIFADPFLDAPETPPLGLLVLREQGPGVPPGQGVLADTVLVEAREAGVRVHEVTSEQDHPVLRLAEVMALTDYLAAYAALGLGLDPSTNPHVANLRAADRP